MDTLTQQGRNRNALQHGSSAWRPLRNSVFVLLAFGVITGPLFAQGRQERLLNRSWRFSLGDHAGAEAPAYRDARWQRIGLPHSFGIPYFAAPRFYVGYGWYRRHLPVVQLGAGDRYALDFQAAFQDAEVFVNGQRVGHHLGGYTGFEYDITKALHHGDNVIAVRLNNRWNAQLNPRAGEHNFNGGIYRNVTLVHTGPLHVDWYGTFVTTPGLSAAGGPVHVATDVRNDSAKTRQFTLRTVIEDQGHHAVVEVSSQASAAPGTVVTVQQQTATVLYPALWSPESPSLYTAVTHVIEGGREVDTFHTVFGFRWIGWTPDGGFFLNGQHHFFHGADAHQDHAGWGDAVTDAGAQRDVRQVKDAGMDFIRGSHYPHSPAFSDACDQTGVLLWEENSFWGTGGAKMEGGWTASAYPPNVADQAAFESNVEQSLAEMIRVHRNHPSIIAWSMGNEVFFSDPALMPKVRTFLAKLVAETHELDPTRPAAIGGVQRGGIDHIGDVAGYNGDGATLFLNPGVANAVTEYGSTVTVRPGEYAPGFGDLGGQPEFAWRGGQALWAAFDHGSIFSTMGQMGMVDYSRLPKRTWYWYRNAYRGIAPPEWPVPGTATALTLTSNHAPGPLRADGTDDTQLIVQVVDARGKLLSNAPPVTLRIVSGPGELPTGRSIQFTPQGDIAIRDGEAAIEMRAYQSGTIQLEASSPGLREARLSLRAEGGPSFVRGVTPLVADRPYHVPTTMAQPGQMTDLALDRPTEASSSLPDHSSRLGDDGDGSTYWQPAAEDTAGPWWQIDFEGQCTPNHLHIAFAGKAVPFLVQIPDGQGGWHTVLDSGPSADSTSWVFPAGVQTRFVRFLFPKTIKAPEVLEVQIVGSPLQ